jgi:ABC-type bacteriocin/lantibiotic exporter with double-glycine peptidase domain
MHALSIRFALVAGLALSAGCQSQRIQPTQLSDSAVTLDLPLVHQDALYECGLASMSALCQYWGVEIPDTERASLAREAEEKKGLSGGELRTALNDLGLEVFLFHGTLDRSPTGLYRHVDAGRPPLVMLALGNGDDSNHHYCLVLGYDESRGNLILLDPIKGQVLTPTAVFDRNWERCERFTLLACPADRTSEVAMGPSFTTNPQGEPKP